MPVLINFKICDNSQDCSGIGVCPTGAFYWDSKNQTIAINDRKCINCGRCESSCPVGAIRVAKDEKEYQKIKQEIEKDPRRILDLFVDRYGASPISLAFLISEDKFKIQILRAVQLAVVELFNHDSIQCLLYSIPIRELFENFDVDIKYRKIEVVTDLFLKRYQVKKLPSLVFFEKGKMIGRVAGYYSASLKGELIRKIGRVLLKKAAS